MTEHWKTIILKGVTYPYEVSSLGRVRRTDSGKTLKPLVNSKGYATVGLSLNCVQKRVAIHRLVALAFCQKAEGCNVVNHLDGDKTNCRWDNLEWTTHKGNTAHAVKTGLHQRGERNGFARITEDVVRRIRGLRGKVPQTQIAALCGVSTSNVSKIINDKAWQHVK